MTTPSLRRHLSFANACSLLALLVATGTGTAYAANTVRSKDIVNGQVKAVDLGASSVTSAKIKNGTVGLADLVAGAVDSSRVKDGSLTGVDLKDGSVSAVDVLASSLTAAQIADDTITAQQLATDAVGSAELATDAVGSAELATDAVGATEIADDTIDGGEVINGSLGLAELAPNAVDAGKVVNDSLSFNDLAGGSATGAVSLGAGAVPNGRCEDVGIAIGGDALAGDAVVFSVRGDMPEGIFFYGMQVVSPTLVASTLCNLSGAAMPAIDNLPVRILTFR